jgi:hypothetical protein
MNKLQQIYWMLGVKWYAWESADKILHIDLRGANLSYADLHGANLSYANLYDAILTDCKMNWGNHWLIGQRLFYAIDDNDVRKFCLAGGISITGGNYCWQWWLNNYPDSPEKAWALRTMASWVRDGDDAPDVLRQYVGVDRD